MLIQQRPHAIRIGLLSAADAQFSGVNAAGNEQSVQSGQIRAVNIGLDTVTDHGDAGFIDFQPVDTILEHGSVGLSPPKNDTADFLILCRQRSRRHIRNAVL